MQSVNQESGYFIKDKDVENALSWFYEIAVHPDQLKERVKIAQQYYLEKSKNTATGCFISTDLLLQTDLIASYLAQAEAMLFDRKAYDVTLASQIIPFIKTIGINLKQLSSVNNVVERVQRMLSPRNSHPDGCLFELITAAKYANELLNVSFINEMADQKTPDICIFISEEEEIHIECKRLHKSKYELTEIKKVNELYKKLSDFILEKKISKHIDVNFFVESQNIPDDYLETKLRASIDSNTTSSVDYHWKDTISEGSIQTSNIQAIKEDIKNNYLMVNSKMARLLTNRKFIDDKYFILLNGMMADQDPRFLDTIHSASIITWCFSAQESIQAKTRHLKKRLSQIDLQLINSPIGIGHIGMWCENEIDAADSRQKRNFDTISSFKFDSNLCEIDLHYFLPRISENHSWMIDETAQSFCRKKAFLKDQRLLSNDEDYLIEDSCMAWHLPPPQI